MDVVRFLKDKTRIPVIGAPLFTVSYPELVLAQCKAGIVGSFPALNARPEEKLGEWITMMKKELNDYQNKNPEEIVAPFAVNQICHHSNSRLEHDMEVCVEHEIPIIITSLRAPQFVVDAVHSYGGAVIHDVINIRHAKKAISEGADGLILVCAGAGGHAGTLSPFALVREVREFFDGLIVLSGSISHGASVLSAQAMGADLAYIGTRFIATQEANASEGYKEMIVESNANDIMYSATFTGVNGNYLKPSVVKAGLDPENLPYADKHDMNFSSGPGDNQKKAWKDIWGSGQGIGNLHEVPTVREAVDTLVEEYEEAKNFLTKGAV
ncbi:MAG TPA: nitronate monooxygenase [Gammaproteobacteria bacterium]|mgnify:FL=1|jgi:nitronate monooxygenase|nr:nitronate monooxygenase [Gammaproteobacteria bacterium]HIA96455.1 nitronate monooxygenase [Gammaproteobacteria bacterium]HIB74834.1 nitronate monooxygenase [Gammaproteobacteria bacterium]HIN73582.1 nitronate monooxygenase [Gammaproteobacteria bacterium]HIO05243.1 nitronate monooxygenase [Gammaproteobacteria bacterium]|tara:strand:- start:693 stop:1667 length:975 start_codon:yes stop_codon:yes gene_type:complete